MSNTQRRQPITAQDLRQFVFTAAMIDPKYLDNYLEEQAHRFNGKVLSAFCQDVAVESLNKKQVKNASFKTW